MRAERAEAEKALEAAHPAARPAASRTLAAVSGGLAALQLSAARELLSDASPVKAKAFRRLQDLVGILPGTGDEADARAARGLMRLAADPKAWEIAAAKIVVKHPVLKVRTAVAYKDMAAGLRSLVHTLTSGRDDYLEVAAREADLRRAAALWGSPRATPNGRPTRSPSGARRSAASGCPCRSA